jgi:hypothetical protein
VSRGILYLWKNKRDGRPPASKRPGPVVHSLAIAALTKAVVGLKIVLADRAVEANLFKGLAKGLNSGSTGTTASSTCPPEKLWPAEKSAVTC